MAHRRHTSPGAPDLQTRLGWLQGSTRNGMEWGAFTLLEISHSRGCYLKFAVLLMQRVCSPKWPKTKEPQVLCPGGLYSWWHFTSPANGSRSHDCAPVTWAYGIPCPPMVSPNVGLRKEDKLLYLDHHLIWCVESGFRPAHFPPLLSWSPTIVGGLQIILQSFFGLNPKLIMLNTISYSESFIFMGSEYTPLCKALCTFITVT